MAHAGSLEHCPDLRLYQGVHASCPTGLLTACASAAQAHSGGAEAQQLQRARRAGDLPAYVSMRPVSGHTTFARARCRAAATVPGVAAGVCRLANGDQYCGEWRDDVQHGPGTCTYAQGGKYRGQWHHGLRHGQGSCAYHNGDTYKGAGCWPVHRRQTSSL